MITTHPTTTRSHRKVSRLALIVVLTLAVIAGVAFTRSNRAEAVIPLDHGSMVCNGNQVQARPPTYGRATKLDVEGRFETVYWRADLYRWNGQAWAPYITNKPWYMGLLQTNDVVYRGYDGRWHQVPNHQPLMYVAFNNLPRGQYATASTWYGSSPAWQSTTQYCNVP